MEEKETKKERWHHWGGGDQEGKVTPWMRRGPRRKGDTMEEEELDNERWQHREGGEREWKVTSWMRRRQAEKGDGCQKAKYPTTGRSNSWLWPQKKRKIGGLYQRQSRIFLVMSQIIEVKIIELKAKITKQCQTWTDPSVCLQFFVLNFHMSNHCKKLRAPVCLVIFLKLSVPF